VQHRLAHNLDRCQALQHEVIVKLLQVEGRPLLLLEIFAELHDLELAQGVVEVGRVGGAALGLD
jgi:uncharacterized Fe-S cluster-containing protein